MTNSLEKIIAEWSYWNNSPASSIRRSVLNSIPELQKDLVLVVQGIRRSGKSTLLSQIMQDKKLDPQNCFFINFEDPRVSDSLNPQLLDQILDYATDKVPDSARYFFFDEIQNVKDWPKWFHSKLERPSDNFFIVTGSNASLLSGNIGSALTGRHQTIELFPFSFDEFQHARKQGKIEDYMQIGGFPRISSYPEPMQLLREYFTDIIERDVRRNLSLRSASVITQLVKGVFESMGSELSQRSLANQFGLAPDTVGEYLSACEAAYLILHCPFFSFSERQRVVRSRKFYPIDLGLRNSVITKGGGDRGKNLEALVYISLRRKFTNVCYWREKGEVDFVVQDGNKIIPYQVSWDGIKPRHEAALDEFLAEFPQADNPIFITRDTIEEFLL